MGETGLPTIKGAMWPLADAASSQTNFGRRSSSGLSACVVTVVHKVHYCKRHGTAGVLCTVYCVLVRPDGRSRGAPCAHQSKSIGLIDLPYKVLWVNHHNHVLSSIWDLIPRAAGRVTPRIIESPARRTAKDLTFRHKVAGPVNVDVNSRYVEPDEHK